MDRLDVIELTAGKPFTAGAVVLVEGRLVVTLNRDHLPPGYERDWDDVAALLLVRPADCPLLTGEPTIAEVVAAGVEPVERDPLPPETRLWVHPEEASELIAGLLTRHAELEPLLV